MCGKFHKITLKNGEDLNILDTNVELNRQDPFGQIRSGHLKVCGKARIGIIRKSPYHHRQSEHGLYLCHGCLEPFKIGEYLPDRPDLADTLVQFTHLQGEKDGKLTQ
jgi:hypothetical protein